MICLPCSSHHGNPVWSKTVSTQVKHFGILWRKIKHAGICVTDTATNKSSNKWHSMQFLALCLFFFFFFCHIRVKICVQRAQLSLHQEASQHSPPFQQKSRTNSSVWRDYGITEKPANKSRQPLWLKESKRTPQHLRPCSVQGLCDDSFGLRRHLQLISSCPNFPCCSPLSHRQNSTSSWGTRSHSWWSRAWTTYTTFATQIFSSSKKNHSKNQQL